MNKDNKLQLFQEQSVRTHWDEDLEKWFFSVQDIVQILSESKDVKQYIKRMRSRNSELSANRGIICTPVEMKAADGKIQAADMEEIYNINFNSPEFEGIKNQAELNPDKKGNIRDYANVCQLVCLVNLENINTLLIKEKISQADRLKKLNQIAIEQMNLLTTDNSQLLKEKTK